MKRYKFFAPCLLVIVITLVGIFVLPTQAEAATVASGTCGKNLTWTLDDAGTLTVSGTGPMYNFSWDGSAPWSNSDRYYDYSNYIKTVVIEDGVTTIASYAFRGCTNLTSVTIGGSVTSIESRAFSGCTSLTSVTIGDSVTTIDSNAFVDCDNLTYNTYADGKYLGNPTNPYVALMDTTSTSITSFTIHPDTKIIGNSAFSGCTSLRSITIPDSVTSIGSYAFDDCDNLTYNTYAGGKYLGNPTNPYVALVDTTSTSITSFTIRPDTKIIGSSAFYNCTSLTSVTIPDSVTTIGSSAFSGCTSLTSVTIPDSVTTIGSSAFSGCTSLTSVTIGDSITSVSYSVFYNCTSLESITIPGSVTIIYEYAFECCYNLKNVYYAGTQTQWNAIYIREFPFGDPIDHDRLNYATIHYNHVHDYTLMPAVTVEPTCTEVGYTEYTCVYGETYRDNYVPALGHAAGSDAVVTPPTCTEQGYTTSSCARCGKTVTTDYVAALSHDYTGPEATIEPTCTEQGYTGNTCTRCGDIKKTNMVDAVGHKMVLTPAVAATCTTPGLTAGTKCEYCGLVGVAQKEVAALGGNHDYTADPTTCAECGNVRASLQITNVTLRPGCAGLYFKGSFAFDSEVKVSRYGIAVSTSNRNPVADDSDASSLYTADHRSVLISNILDGGADDAANGRKYIYARPYVLLEDGTYIYGEVVVTNLCTLVETVDSQLFESLGSTSQTALSTMYQQFAPAMENWLIPNIKKFGEE